MQGPEKNGLQPTCDPDNDMIILTNQQKINTGNLHISVTSGA